MNVAFGRPMQLNGLTGVSSVKLVSCNHLQNNNGSQSFTRHLPSKKASPSQHEPIVRTKRPCGPEMEPVMANSLVFRQLHVQTQALRRERTTPFYGLSSPMLSSAWPTRWGGREVLGPCIGSSLSGNVGCRYFAKAMPCSRQHACR